MWKDERNAEQQPRRKLAKGSQSETARASEEGVEAQGNVCLGKRKTMKSELLSWV